VSVIWAWLALASLVALFTYPLWIPYLERVYRAVRGSK